MNKRKCIYGYKCHAKCPQKGEKCQIREDKKREHEEDWKKFLKMNNLTEFDEFWE